MTPPVRSRSLIAYLVFLLGTATTAQAQPPSFSGVRPPRAVDEVRGLSNSWQRRLGPERKVVDQVCLVPDVATFLEAIATWDEHHFFPILIDDIELNFKFLRAFQPARIVRLPRRAEEIPADAVWPQAVAAVGRAWSADSGEDPETLAGDAVPKSLGATPPGVVLTEPDSPMLAGAVALAAGRFQPLVRWDVERRASDVLSEDEAQQLAASLEKTVTTCVPAHSRLGDDCDFLTLAGDWPYRYNSAAAQEGPKAIDDLVGRSNGGRMRWAFAGRLMGDPATSVYRAMCSLFLQPKSALLVNTYDEKDRTWATYTMRGAARRLARLLPVVHRSGDRANLAGWHQAFDPVNRAGLVLLNSQGEPARFGLVGGYGLVGDIPQTEPTAIAMIHSHSAANPNDPNTVAGRWLANGAFVYYGSMHEPFLSAFRPPDLVAELIEAGAPLVAALRQSAYEARGGPWKLVYLGDPLYRVASGVPPRRLAPADWPTGASWPHYGSSPRPDVNSSNDERLGWAVRTAVAHLQRAPGQRAEENLDGMLNSIRRARLEPSLKLFFDALVSDALLQANRPAELRSQLTAIPLEEQSPAVTRILETCQFQLLDHYLGRREFARAQRVWSELMLSNLSREALEQLTLRMGALVDSPSHRMEWRALLIAMGRRVKDTPAQQVIESERARIEGIR